MKLRVKIIVLCVLLVMGITRLVSQDAVALPPLPVDALTTQLIFPDGRIEAVVSANEPAHRYLFPVLAGDTIELRLNRLEGELVPFLRLSTADGKLLAEQEAQDLAGRRVNIEHTATDDDWYLVEATYDPASESYGAFELSMTGATPALFDLLDAGQPPTVDAAIYLTRGTTMTLDDELASFAIALNANEMLTVTVDPVVDIEALYLADALGQELVADIESVDGSLTYTSENAEWVVLALLTGGNEELRLSIAINAAAEPAATLADYRLSDLITPSPLPTSTNTPLPTETPRPTATRRPTSTPRPSPTPIRCSGTLVSRLESGDTGRVIPGPSNNMRDRPTTGGGRITQIPGGGVFSVLDGPVCADGYAWYQVNFDGIVGWTAEADDSDYWIEPWN